MERYSRPSLVFADARGHILDFPALEMVGAEGMNWRRLKPGEWIPLPEGSELFLLKDRLPIGYSRRSNSFTVLRENPYNKRDHVQAVAAFLAPAYTATLLAAYKTETGGPILPLFSYGAVGWHRGTFVVAALRTDPDERQDVKHLKLDLIREKATTFLEKYRHNRLIQHLSRCALTYACPAARNFFLQRWEAPLPSSPRCNARCLGCISFQDNPHICATQERISFVPTPEEIAETALLHLSKAEKGIVSFGQGCEGEPLLQVKTIEKAVKLIRETTSRGTININTNGSLPSVLDGLAKAGLDSLRVSINSFQERYYLAYYRPKSYTFRDVKDFIRKAKDLNIFVSLNYFILPGFTDDPAEMEAFENFIIEVPPDLIQMRNFNIDYEWYLKTVNFVPKGKPLGIMKWMEKIRTLHSSVRFGYFNPPLRD